MTVFASMLTFFSMRHPRKRRRASLWIGLVGSLGAHVVLLGGVLVLGSGPPVEEAVEITAFELATVSVTPLEAAVATRERYLFELVVAHGALLTPANAPALHCFAVQEHATEIAAYVAARFPPPASCDGVQLPW